MIVSINDTIIENTDISYNLVTDEQLKFDGEKIITPTLDLTLINIDKIKYDENYLGSLFYQQDWYNWPVTIYDENIERYRWIGLLRKYEISDSDSTIKLQSAHDIDKLETACICNYINKTAAEIMYLIMTDIAGISDDIISYSGIQDAISYQGTNYFRVIYTAENNITCKSVLERLYQLTRCCVYTKDNIIHFLQEKPWINIVGTRVYGGNVIQNSYKSEYDDSRIINDYNIAYFDVAVAYKTPGTTAQESQDVFGIQTFSHPEDKQDSTDPNDFPMLPADATCAEFFGDLMIELYQWLKEICSFTIRERLSFIFLGDQLDLDFRQMKREPARLIEKKYSYENKTIDITTEFLNRPYQYIERNTTPPAAPYLAAVIPTYKGMMIKWTINQESNLLGYKIYFTTSPGEWENDSCNWGTSPIDCKNPNITEDGYNYLELEQLNPNVLYCVKVTAYDDYLLESDFSNVLSCRPANNFYNAESCYGNVYSSKIILDSTNSLGGNVPTGFVLYDDSYYDDDYYEPTAFYESEYLYNSSGWQDIIWNSSGDSDDIRFQYRTAADTLTDLMSASWSSEVNAITNKSQIFIGSPKYLQYRFIFYSPFWSDEDYFYVKEVA